MELKSVIFVTFGCCIPSVILATNAGTGDINDATILDRLASLETTVHQQATNQERLETLLQEQTERLSETELMLRQQKDINAALLHRQMVADEKFKDAAFTNEQLLQKLTTLENVSSECKSFGLASAADQTALNRGARQWSETVAFTAYLDHELQHLGIDHPIPYNQILLNEGGAYNPSNGMFVCPDDGFYAFYFQVSTNGVHQIVAKLVVDGVNQVDGISDTYHEYHEAQGGNMAVVQLKRGQSVWVANYRWTDKSTQTSNTYRFATFSGFRIY